MGGRKKKIIITIKRGIDMPKKLKFGDFVTIEMCSKNDNDH